MNGLWRLSGHIVHGRAEDRHPAAPGSIPACQVEVAVITDMVLVFELYII